MNLYGVKAFIPLFQPGKREYTLKGGYFLRDDLEKTHYLPQCDIRVILPEDSNTMDDYFDILANKHTNYYSIVKQ